MGIFDKISSQISDVASNIKAQAANIQAQVGATATSEENAAEADVSFFMEVEPTTAHVTCDVLNVRPTPSTDQARVGTLKRGAEIVVNAICDDWLRIQFEGETRYVFGAYTDYDAPEMTVTASSLNIRKGPGTDFDRIGSLANGSVVRVLADKKGWVKILNGNQIGYVSKEYLK